MLCSHPAAQDDHSCATQASKNSLLDRIHARICRQQSDSRCAKSSQHVCTHRKDACAHWKESFKLVARATRKGRTQLSFQEMPVNPSLSMWLHTCSHPDFTCCWMDYVGRSRLFAEINICSRREQDLQAGLLLAASWPALKSLQASSRLCPSCAFFSVHPGLPSLPDACWRPHFQGSAHALQPFSAGGPLSAAPFPSIPSA